MGGQSGEVAKVTMKMSSAAKPFGKIVQILNPGLLPIVTLIKSLFMPPNNCTSPTRAKF